MCHTPMMCIKNMLHLVFLFLFTQTVVCRTLLDDTVTFVGTPRQHNYTSNNIVFKPLVGAGGNQLQLCECQSAVGYPNGLGCDKEGWFISSFEHEGSWASGGGLVPLSHAVCCRPCLPSELPADATSTIPADTTPVAVVSLGCHPAPGRSWQSMQCDDTTASFVTGFTDSERVANYYDVFYPQGATQCCTPGLLLSSGDVWELVRCDCEASSTKSCGETSTQRLLWGFESARLSSSMEYVPVAPLECCGLCLGAQPHNLQDCKDLSFCSGNGVCALGACQCYDGWGGPDCSQRAGGGGDDDDDDDSFPSWATWVMIVGGIASSMLSTYALRARCPPRWDSDSEGGDDHRQPLIAYMHDLDSAGSVGSVDTASDIQEDADEDLPDGQELTSTHLEHEPSVEGAGAGADDESGSARLEIRTTQSQASQPPGTPTSLPATPNTTHTATAAGDVAGGDVRHEGQEGGKDEGVVKGGATIDWPVEALAEALCTICVERPLQVALIPCGHANMCRRCSRRLDKCPFCRKEILRRQRLFYSV